MLMLYQRFIVALTQHAQVGVDVRADMDKVCTADGVELCLIILATLDPQLIAVRPTDRRASGRGPCPGKHPRSMMWQHID